MIVLYKFNIFLCIQASTNTPHVATTGFSTHEIEIFDFVIECGEKRIAANEKNVL